MSILIKRKGAGMSLVITRSLFCDYESCGNWFGQTTERGATELRVLAKKAGWTRGPYGRGDPCPYHRPGSVRAGRKDSAVSAFATETNADRIPDSLTRVIAWWMGRKWRQR